MTVLQLKHANVSKFALLSSDLLLIIASPHSGHGRIDGGSGGGIALRLLAQSARLQVNPIQRGGKKGESTGHEEGHDHICWHRIAPWIRGAHWNSRSQHFRIPRALRLPSLSANFPRFLIYLNFRNPLLPHLCGPEIDRQTETSMNVSSRTTPAGQTSA